MKLNSKKFKELKTKWYKKLEKSGFNDIEQANGNLKDFHSFRFKSKKIKNVFFETQRYYELASQLLHTYPFPDRTSKKIWKLHASGESNLAISDLMKVSYRVVEVTVNKIAGSILNEDD